LATPCAVYDTMLLYNKPYFIEYVYGIVIK
jgi:hypothetical protein